MSEENDALIAGMVRTYCLPYDYPSRGREYEWLRWQSLGGNWQETWMDVHRFLDDEHDYNYTTEAGANYLAEKYATEPAAKFESQAEWARHVLLTSHIPNSGDYLDKESRLEIEMAYRLIVLQGREIWIAHALQEGE